MWGGTYSGGWGVIRGAFTLGTWELGMHAPGPGIGLATEPVPLGALRQVTALPQGLTGCCAPSSVSALPHWARLEHGCQPASSRLQLGRRAGLWGCGRQELCYQMLQRGPPPRGAPLRHRVPAYLAAPGSAGKATGHRPQVDPYNISPATNNTWKVSHAN